MNDNESWIWIFVVVLFGIASTILFIYIFTDYSYNTNNANPKCNVHYFLVSEVGDQHYYVTEDYNLTLGDIPSTNGTLCADFWFGNTKEATQPINYTQMNENPEWMHYAHAMNFSCFGFQCSPTESLYVKGIGMCYNNSEGLICPT